jgi:acetyl esterase/lipase
MATVGAALTFGVAAAQTMPGMAPPAEIQDDGTVTVPSFALPFSSYASREARDALVRQNRNPLKVVPDINKMRQATDERAAPQIAQMKTLYPTTSVRKRIGSVPVEVFTPAGGPSKQNANRVLINLHGGAFVAGGGGPGGSIESIPIASVGRIQVVAVDYRLAPENHFPAASEDVATVYRELLRTHRPQDIGIYGCSAGGALTAQAISWFLKEKLPLPGAIGIFCASTHEFGEGDSSQIWARAGSLIRSIPPVSPEAVFGRDSPYFAGISRSDPLAVPAASPEILRAFPPTLFLTGTRAADMSGAVQGHLELVELGVNSQLLLFDGLDHGFFSDPSFPESRRAYTLIARFFAENLGHTAPRASAERK